MSKVKIKADMKDWWNSLIKINGDTVTNIKEFQITVDADTGKSKISLNGVNMETKGAFEFSFEADLEKLISIDSGAIRPY